MFLFVIRFPQMTEITKILERLEKASEEIKSESTTPEGFIRISEELLEVKNNIGVFFNDLEDFYLRRIKFYNKKSQEAMSSCENEVYQSNEKVLSVMEKVNKLKFRISELEIKNRYYKNNR